jgi:hypothetical protein
LQWWQSSVCDEALSLWLVGWFEWGLYHVVDRLDKVCPAALQWAL